VYVRTAVNATSLPRSNPREGWPRLAPPGVALALGALMLALTAAAIPLSVLSNGQSSGLIILPFAIVGAFVVRRTPRNPIGWILIVLSLAFLVASDGGQYAVMAYYQGYHGLPAPRVGVFLADAWIWLIILLPLPLTLFPDGGLSRRWRRVVCIYAGGCAVFVAGATWQDVTGITASHIQVDSSGELASAGSGPAGGVLTGVFAVVYITFCLASVLRLVLSYRGSAGDYRQQLKWLLSGGAISVLGLVLTLGLSNAHSPLLRAVASHSFFGIVALPIGLGVGILKYRLYDIDRLISRTISYLILSGVLAGVFIGVVALTTRALPLSSPVGVAASTLAAAALFNPLRTRAQRLVDRRFNRARYDAEAIVAAFVAQVQDAVDLDTMRGDLLATVERAVEPSQSSLWIRPPTASR
jgi:hypothetical protein